MSAPYGPASGTPEAIAFLLWERLSTDAAREDQSAKSVDGQLALFERCLRTVYRKGRQGAAITDPHD